MSTTLEPALPLGWLRVGDEGGVHIDLAKAEDAQLASLAAAGQYRPFEELVRRYRNEVFALAWHFIRNREEAWDLSQEVFLKVYRSVHRFRGYSSFKTWLLRITANQCKDYLKKRRLHTVPLDTAQEANREASSARTPSQELEAAEVGEAIVAALDQLPIKHRTAFILREFEGLSYEEMADVMQCNLGTVMSRLHHARKKMRGILVERGFAEEKRS